MSIPDIYFKLVRKLRERSELGEVNWKETAKENTFTVSFEKFSVGISRGEEEDGPYVKFYISDNEGRIVDDYWIYQKWSEEMAGTDESDFDFFSQLFDLARRKAMRVDEAISEISQELDKSGTVGTPPEKEEKEENDLPF